MSHNIIKTRDMEGFHKHQYHNEHSVTRRPLTVFAVAVGKKEKQRCPRRLQHVYFEFTSQANVLQPDAFHRQAAHKAHTAHTSHKAYTRYAVSNRK
jgi:hypothetical protein